MPWTTQGLTWLGWDTLLLCPRWRRWRGLISSKRLVRMNTAELKGRLCYATRTRNRWEEFHGGNALKLQRGCDEAGHLGRVWDFFMTGRLYCGNPCRILEFRWGSQSPASICPRFPPRTRGSPTTLANGSERHCGRYTLGRVHIYDRIPGARPPG